LTKGKGKEEKGGKQRTSGLKIGKVKSRGSPSREKYFNLCGGGKRLRGDSPVSFSGREKEGETAHNYRRGLYSKRVGS